MGLKASECRKTSIPQLLYHIIAFYSSPSAAALPPSHIQSITVSFSKFSSFHSVCLFLAACLVKPLPSSVTQLCLFPSIAFPVSCFLPPSVSSSLALSALYVALHESALIRHQITPCSQKSRKWKFH